MTKKLIKELAEKLKSGIVSAENVRNVLLANNNILRAVIKQWLNDGDVLALEKLAGNAKMSNVLWLEYNYGA